LLYGLSRFQALQDARGEHIRAEFLAASAESARLESGRVSLLARLIDEQSAGEPDADRMKEWQRLFAVLRRVAGKKLREFRNQHVHSIALFEHSTLDGFLRGEFTYHRLGPIQPGAGMAVLAALVTRVLDAVPGGGREPMLRLLGEGLDLPNRLAGDHGLPAAFTESAATRGLIETEPAEFAAYLEKLRERES
jgi:hypothetical protein